MITDDIIIREHRESDPLSEITELLHRAYKELADMGLLYLASHQSDSVTLSRITDGTTFLALHGSVIVGTITVYSQTDNCEFYNRNGVWHFGQFAVDPNYRKQGIGKTLIESAEQYAQARGGKIISLDTAIPAIHLIKHYEKYGYLIVDEVQWKEANYKSVIMAKTLVTADHQ